MSQEIEPVPWGAQDRFQAHYIVKPTGLALDELLARTNLQTQGHFATIKVSNVEWVGGNLARVLNSDEELRNMILKLSYKDAHIWVEPTKNGIRIHGKWKSSYELQISKELFQVYDKIALHIKKMSGSPPV